MKRLAAVASVVTVALAFLVAPGAQAQSERTIDASVNSTCAKDVTGSVISFVSGGGSMKLQPNGCYIVNTKLNVGGSLNGNGATIRKTSQAALTPKDATNCKQHAGLVKLSSNASISNVRLERIGPGGYNPCHYAEHGIEIIGSSNTAITNVTESNVWGDCLYMQGVTGVEVKTLKCLSNGRQGGAISRGKDVHIDGFTVAHSDRSGFDFEANNNQDALTNIEIENFDFTSNLIAFPSQGYNSQQDNIWIHDGIVRDALSFVYDRQTRPSENGCRNGGTRQNWKVENVTVDAKVGAYGPGSAVFCGTRGVVFRNNVMPGGYVVFESSTGTLVAQNNCVKEVRELAQTVAVQQSGNTKPPCGSGPPPITEPTTGTTQPPVTTTRPPVTTTTRPPVTTAPSANVKVPRAQCRQWVKDLEAERAHLRAARTGATDVALGEIRAAVRLSDKVHDELTLIC